MVVIQDQFSVSPFTNCAGATFWLMVYFSQLVSNFSKFTITHGTDSDGNPTESSAATVVTGEDALVQSICGAVWS